MKRSAPKEINVRKPGFVRENLPFPPPVFAECPFILQTYTIVVVVRAAVVVIVKEQQLMSFGHKKLDVYRVLLNYVSWVHDFIDKLTGKHRYAKDQLLRISQSIPLNIAEGNGKFSEADRNRFFVIARGSALECAHCTLSNEIDHDHDHDEVL